jgi:hypothetical protein
MGATPREREVVMQLEEGKSYHTAKGELIGPLKAYGSTYGSSGKINTMHVPGPKDCRLWAADTGQCCSNDVDHLVREYGAAPAEGRKDDGGKPPLHLIPPEFLYAIAEILDFGQRKYAPRNWEKGLDWSRVYRAAIGHLFDWFARKGPDPETGKSHLWHAACCVMFLVCYEIRGTGADDRPPNEKAGQ